MPDPGHRPLPDGVVWAGDRGDGNYFYRPGELLVAEAELRDRDVERRLDDLGAERLGEPPLRRRCVRYGEDDVGRLEERQAARQRDATAALERYRVALFRLSSPELSVPEVVRTLQRSRSKRRPARISPNVVLTGEQYAFYGPGSNPVPLEEDLPVPVAAGTAGSGVRVSVVDTGLRRGHGWLKDQCESRGLVDDEELDEDGDGQLDIEAGHGTFVAGCVLRAAPGAFVVARGTVDSEGVTDDVAVSGALTSLLGECIDVLNLSLGGYSPGRGREALPMTSAALSALRYENPRMVVVAAAGNRNHSEPFYPAALDDVIGVGALDHRRRKAAFSNFGPWVDAWALGVDIRSSYVNSSLGRRGGTEGGLEGAEWSGTSFAAPAVAGAIAAAISPGD